MAVLKFKDPVTGEEKTIGSKGVNKAFLNEKIATCAPKYLFGTEDLEEGVSDLPRGTLYFVYEGLGPNNLISFKLVDQAHGTPTQVLYAESNMTWIEWGASSYNTLGHGPIIESADGKARFDDGCIIKDDETGLQVRVDALITD